MMKSFAVGLVVGIVLAASVASAQESASRMLTGHDFRTLPLLVRTTWVNGWMAGFAMIAWDGSPVIAACLAKNKQLTVEALRLRLDQYLATHPGKAGRSVPILLVEAMGDLCQ